MILNETRAIEAVASPHRIEILATLGDLERASIAELARRLGRTPHSLYYHMRLLEEAGVVVPAEVRRRGRRDETVWRLAAERFMVGGPGGDEFPTPAAGKAIDSMLRLASRELRGAVEREASGADEQRRVIGLRMKGRVDSSTLEKVNRLIDRIEALVRKSSDDPTGEMFAVTIVMAPTEDKSKEVDDVD